MEQESYSFLVAHLCSTKILRQTWRNYKYSKEQTFSKFTITIHFLIDMCKEIYTMSMED